MDRLLFQAAQTGQKLKMIYLDADNKTSYRIIRVFGVKQHTVMAYCFKRRKIRTFTKANILSVEPVRKSTMGA
ncbi:hypothetical protein [Virgibacillus doumboii]|uniref:hypothetical protein n=1 Tax=Virgibacillus doumboii TaxID=2697503 RepID=UPI0013DFED18|nr:hypothetical protein [Virgibacillus doumboii]